MTSHNHVAFRQILENYKNNNNKNKNNKAISKTAFAMHAVKKLHIEIPALQDLVISSESWKLYHLQFL